MKFIFQIWDIRANRCLETTCQHDGTVHGLSMLRIENSNKGDLVSASSDQTIRVWSIETFNQIQYDDRHEAEVTALHGNARHIMSGAADAKIKVMNEEIKHECKRIRFRFGIGFPLIIWNKNSFNRFWLFFTNKFQ